MAGAILISDGAGLSTSTVMFDYFVEHIAREFQAAHANLRTSRFESNAPLLFRIHIEVFNLPAYMPEANPDEYLNRDLKTNLRSQESKRDAQSLQRAVRKFLEFLQHKPERVRSYFTHAPVSYASQYI